MAKRSTTHSEEHALMTGDCILNVQDGSNSAPKENPEQQQPTRYMGINTYEEFCTIEERKIGLFTDMLSHQNQLMDVITNLSGNVLTVFGIGGSMGAIGSLTCAHARMAAVWIVIIFLLGLPIPFLLAWKRLNRKQPWSTELMQREENLKIDMDMCYKELTSKPTVELTNDRHIVQTEEFNRRLEFTKKSVERGVGSVDIGPFYNDFWVIMLLGVLVGVLLAVMIYFLYTFDSCPSSLSSPLPPEISFN